MFFFFVGISIFGSWFISTLLLIVVVLVVPVQSLFPLGRPVEASRTPSPPLASFTGFRSRIWTLLFVFGFFSVFGCWLISVFVFPSVDCCCLGCACSQVYCPKSGARLRGKSETTADPPTQRLRRDKL